MIRRLSLCMVALLGASAALADWELNMPRGVTEVSAETYEIHMQVFWWCVAIAVVVFGAMIVALVKHRKSRGVQPAKFNHSMTAEVIWTIIPIVILLLMAIPAAETLIRVEDSRNPDMTVVVTGYQWKWHYAYQGEDVSFFSNLDRRSNEARRKGSGIDPESVEHYLRNVDKPLVVPVGAKVRVLLTSNDVLHAWWVPDLGVKKDAIPGFINELWFQADEVGSYRGQCAELCGMDHGYMPIVVEVVEPEEFQAWMMNEKDTGAKVAAAGE